MEEKNIYQGINEEIFDDEILKTKDMTYVVVFNNGNFAMNNIYDNIVKSVASDFVKFRFCRGDNIECEKIIKKLGIRILPTLLVYKNGKIIGNIEGIVPKRTLRIYLREILDRDEK